VWHLGVDAHDEDDTSFKDKVTTLHTGLKRQEVLIRIGKNGARDRISVGFRSCIDL
jgi:hypothetical protein